MQCPVIYWFVLLFFHLHIASTFYRSYIVVNKSTYTWYEANNYCNTAFNTQLATIENSQQNEAIRTAMVGVNGIQSGYVWIGLYHDSINASWQWADNVSSLNYTNWESNTPSNGCVVYNTINSSDNTWTSWGCNNTTSFVCNAPGMCNMYICSSYAQLDRVN